ncbi:ABC transporter permease [Nonomuraea sp. SMC257]|uniref:Transport permease protein n=1 Tax=Nonomuraea montanisoli TaxID=2741721 RepID=A0A7Y6IC53_9ACTN|nr:ABC transporter permease [Nonomuraea montanisoli]NUW35505.1 ABC transporter permease [Nonomuraea montanisoli]
MTTTDTARGLPSALEIGAGRALFELRQFFRERDQVIFTFSLPIVLLVLFGSIFRGRFEGSGVTVAQVYTAALIGAGVLSVSLQNLGVSIAVEREQGVLKRLAGTPMPRSAYFLGKILSVMVMSVAEVTLLLTVAVVLYGLRLPDDVTGWLTFGWVGILGLAAGSLLGIAASSLPRSAKSATAVITLPFIVLQFISGVFIPFTELPGWLVGVASVFPLRWMCQGFRAVFLGEGGAALEVTGSYELDRVALVLGAWVIGGLVLCLLTFRWKSRRDR